MLAFRLPAGQGAATLRRGLWQQQRIEVPIIERPDRLLLRTSTHFCINDLERDRLAEAMPLLLQ
jgi:isopenicillin-N epimerase